MHQNKINNVSIVINNYNYEAYLSACIKSAIKQSIPAKEIVVVDDGSTDNSRLVISKYEKFVTSIFQKNKGQAAALNTGFQASSGDWVIFLDADDILKADAIEELQQLPIPESCTRVHYPLDVIDSNGRIYNRLPADNQPLATGDRSETLRKIGSFACMPTSGNCFPRATLEDIMPIPENNFRICADLYLVIHTTLLGQIAAIERPLGEYRVHDHNHFGCSIRFTADTKKLINRIHNHKMKCMLIENYTDERKFHLNSNYITLFGLLDFFILKRLSPKDCRSTMEEIRTAIKVRASRFRQPKYFPYKKLLVALGFFTLQHLPRFLLRTAVNVLNKNDKLVNSLLYTIFRPTPLDSLADN